MYSGSYRRLRNIPLVKAVLEHPRQRFSYNGSRHHLCPWADVLNSWTGMQVHGWQLSHHSVCRKLYTRLLDIHEMRLLYPRRMLANDPSVVRRVFFSTEFGLHYVLKNKIPFLYRITAPGPIMGDLAIQISQRPTIFSTARLQLQIGYLLSKVDLT
ncbi:unnamed protein product [Dicrocoelium dendriticum]|nr:unnamed protein product [Dicrocoelium dendriticum]